MARAAFSHRPHAPRRRSPLSPAPHTFVGFVQRSAPHVPTPGSARALAVSLRRSSFAVEPSNPPRSRASSAHAQQLLSPAIPAKIHAAVAAWEYFSCTHLAPTGARDLEALLAHPPLPLSTNLGVILASPPSTPLIDPKEGAITSEQWNVAAGTVEGLMDPTTTTPRWEPWAALVLRGAHSQVRTIVARSNYGWAVAIYLDIAVRRAAFDNETYDLSQPNCHKLHEASEQRWNTILWSLIVAMQQQQASDLQPSPTKRPRPRSHDFDHGTPPPSPSKRSRTQGSSSGSSWCFRCGRYGHRRGACTESNTITDRPCTAWSTSLSPSRSANGEPAATIATSAASVGPPTTAHLSARTPCLHSAASSGSA